MTAPILRSAALQRALSLVPARRSSTGTSGTFASTLQRVQAPSSTSTASRGTAVPNRSTLLETALPLSGITSASGGGQIPFQGLIEAAARKYGIDPALLAGVVKQESNFNPNAQSPAGARGLTQLMPATARGLGVTDPSDPAQSLEAGARFLSGLLKQFQGNKELALAAYNAGPVAVQRYGGIPPYEETQRYVPKVLGLYEQFKRAGIFTQVI